MSNEQKPYPNGYKGNNYSEDYAMKKYQGGGFNNRNNQQGQSSYSNRNNQDEEQKDQDFPQNQSTFKGGYRNKRGGNRNNRGGYGKDRKSQNHNEIRDQGYNNRQGEKEGYQDRGASFQNSNYQNDRQNKNNEKEVMNQSIQQPQQNQHQQLGQQQQPYVQQNYNQEGYKGYQGNNPWKNQQNEYQKGGKYKKQLQNNRNENQFPIDNIRLNSFVPIDTGSNSQISTSQIVENKISVGAKNAPIQDLTQEKFARKIKKACKDLLIDKLIHEDIVPTKDYNLVESYFNKEIELINKLKTLSL